jgi:hypothetical protein
MIAWNLQPDRHLIGFLGLGSEHLRGSKWDEGVPPSPLCDCVNRLKPIDDSSLGVGAVAFIAP